MNDLFRLIGDMLFSGLGRLSQLQDEYSWVHSLAVYTTFSLSHLPGEGDRLHI